MRPLCCGHLCKGEKDSKPTQLTARCNALVCCKSICMIAKVMMRTVNSLTMTYLRIRMFLKDSVFHSCLTLKNVMSI